MEQTKPKLLFWQGCRAARPRNRTNEAIYESCEVKRTGADSVSREPPHIPLAVGVGRSGPSPTPPTTRVVHPRDTSPEPEAEGGPPARPTTSAMADVIRDAHPSIRDHPRTRTSPIIAIQGTPPFS